MAKRAKKAAKRKTAGRRKNRPAAPRAITNSSGTAIVKAARAAVVAAAQPQDKTTPPPRKRPRNVDDMTRPELEDYAKEVGLLPRALQLSDDRLRQNIKAFLTHTRDDE